jgi:Flp pilus assembly pilin Flp
MSIEFAVLVVLVSVACYLVASAVFWWVHERMRKE